jgi:hypothetical protein
MIQYNSIKVPDGSYKLSPSSLTLFVRNPREWLDNFKGKSTFMGNVSSIRGTIVHYIFESIFDDRTEDRYWEDVETYLASEVANGVIDELQSQEIMNDVRANFYNQCIEWSNNDSKRVLHSEPTVTYKLPIKAKNDYYIAGSIDAIVEESVMSTDMYDESITEPQYKSEYGIRDYKTTNRKVTGIDKYLHQLVTYAIAWNATNKDKVSFVEVINITHSKSKGTMFYTYRKNIDDTDIAKLMKMYKTIIQTHQVAKSNPSIEHLLFREGTDFMGGVKY